MGASYRARQFLLALYASPSSTELKQVREILSPDLMALFLRMQSSEQSHSIQVMQKLLEEGNLHPDLLAGALLHDVGKSLHPLRAWERVMIVLGEALFPVLAARWGRSEPRGWKRAFVVAQQHPEWGAELAARAGASPDVIQLIRRHQDARPTIVHNFGDQCLIHLQLADDES